MRQQGQHLTVDELPEGTHQLAPLLPEGVRLELTNDTYRERWGGGPGFVINGMGFSSDPKPDYERVMHDLAFGSDMSMEDIGQIMDVLVDAELVLT